jgi:hypothetical protein
MGLAMHRVLSLAALSCAVLSWHTPGAEAGTSAFSVAHGVPLHGFHQFHNFGAFTHLRRFGQFNRFGAAPFLAPTLWDWSDWSGPSEIAGGAPVPVVIINMASPPPLRPRVAAPTKTVENGVTVFRGPSRE